MNKPQPKDFGFQESNGFDTESGWMYQGGEEAYFDALAKWERDQKKLKHTPGPWFINSRHLEDGGTWITINEVEGSDAGFAAAYSSYVGKDQAIANAHLIAAAPEMLAILEKITRRWNKENDDVYIGEYQEAMEIISKAKGK
jgi:hypothetical protein